MKKKIIKLSVESEFMLIGISARVSTHKLSWLLNSKLSVDFKQAEDLVIESNNPENTFVEIVNNKIMITRINFFISHSPFQCN